MTPLAAFALVALWLAGCTAAAVMLTDEPTGDGPTDGSPWGANNSEARCNHEGGNTKCDNR